MVAVTAQEPEASVTFKVVPPVIVQPVEAPILKVTAPVPVPPLDERVAVLPYVTVEGVEMAVKVAWFALFKVTAKAAELVAL